MSLLPRLAALAVSAALLVPAAAVAQDTVEHTLSVTGQGEIELKPDRGTFNVGVQRLSRRANVARSRTNASIRAIVGGLKAVEVTRSAITTSDIRIVRQKYRERKDGPVLTRFRASVALRIAVDELTTLGRAIDAASKRGATAVYGTRLGFSDERRAEGALRSEAAALADARTRADAAAAAQGQQVVGVQSIDLDPADNGFATFGALDEASSGGVSADLAPAPTQVFAAKRKVTSEVRVTYLIAPAA